MIYRTKPRRGVYACVLDCVKNSGKTRAMVMGHLWGWGVESWGFTVGFRHPFLYWVSNCSGHELF